MTIRDFQKFLNERKLIHKQNISVLNNTRIGIEGYNWINRALEEVNEPFQVAMGGIPLTFTHRIDKELKNFKNAGITPVFVFNGITHKKIDNTKKLHLASESIDQKRRSAWNAYERGQVMEAAMLFSSTATTLPTDFINFLFKHFTENNVEFFRAPYLTWAQLVYFANKENPLVHAIYAAEEQIMFNASRVILNINFEDGTFEYIDKKEILFHFNITESQLLDACILSGSFFGKTLPSFMDMAKQFATPVFANALEYVKRYHSGLGIIKALMHEGSHDKIEILTQFLMNKALITHHVYFDVDCNAVPNNTATLPKDFHDVIGTKLPNEIYYLLSQGVIVSTAINSLITGVVLEASPLADSQECRNIISLFSPVRAASFNLVTTYMNEYYQKKPINVSNWYSMETEPLERKILKITDGLCWQFSDADIQKQLKLQKAQTVDLPFCLSWKPPVSANLASKFSSYEQIRAFLLLKSLDILGYLNKSKNGYELTGYARALQKAKIYPDQSMVVIELLKHQLLSNRPFTLVYKKYQSIVKPSMKKSKNELELTLIQRVMSMIPMELKPLQWADKAGVNEDLIQFNSIVKTIYRTIRQIIEMLLVVLFLNRNFGPELLQDMSLTQFSLKLPFYQEANTAMGIVARHLLETSVEELNVEQVVKKFSSCVDCIGDFRNKAVPFWNQTVAMVRILYSGKTSSDPNGGSTILEQFEAADKFLQDRLSQLSSFFAKGTNKQQ